MKKKYVKLISLLFVAVFMSGCEVKYRLHVNYDGTLSDSIVIQESKENFEKLGFDMNTYVEQQFEINKKYHFYNDYYKSYLVKENFTRVSGEHNNWSLENFNYSSIFIKSAFESINIINENDKMILEAKGNNLESLFFPNSNDGAPEFRYEKIDLIITSDYDVIESNADEINRLKNEYIWHFDSSNLDKEIYLEMNSKQTIFGRIVANVRNNFVGLCILLVISVVVIIVGIFLYKKYQEVNDF